jgi:hypothetical protein
MTAETNTRWIDQQALADRWGVHVNTVRNYRRTLAGFPRFVQIGPAPNSPYLARLEEIEQYEAARLATSRTGVTAAA